ncbi:TRAP transporter large permease subunit [Vibrio ostreae]|uniref:TRAP transporter large permease subunit n=1 Tax=Vibrio ostreae TaxID=2841925 RepID=A0A975YLU5_9VIBR|nr:TRAP transporter large permease subunit [Vibrio ostreae]
MISGKSPTQAAVMGIVVGLVISPWRASTRINWVDLIGVMQETLTNTLPIVAAVASAGIVIGGF